MSPLRSVQTTSAPTASTSTTSTPTTATPSPGGSAAGAAGAARSGTVVIDPVTRIEGHLRVTCVVENGKVTDAWNTAHDVPRLRDLHGGP